MTADKFNIVKMTDEELEQIELDAFLEEAAKLWDRKFWDDLEYDGGF